MRACFAFAHGRLGTLKLHSVFIRGPGSGPPTLYCSTKILATLHGHPLAEGSSSETLLCGTSVFYRTLSESIGQTHQMTVQIIRLPDSTGYSNHKAILFSRLSKIIG
jgi:hypothetical protein